MTNRPVNQNKKTTNQALLLFLLILDLAGFSLIFPLIPAILEHYLQINQGIDSWIPPTLNVLDRFLPSGDSLQGSRMVAIGGILAVLYSLVQFLAAPYWGRLSDNIGRRPVLLITTTGLAASYILWFFSASFTSFCIARLLGGLSAGNIGVASAAMADMSPPEKRTKAMGMVGAAFGVGFLIGPMIGGLAVHWNPIENLLTGNPFSGAAFVALLFSLGSLLLNSWKFRETLSFSSQLPKKSHSSWITNPWSSFKELSSPAYRQTIWIHLIYVLLFSAYEFTFSFYFRLEYGLEPAQIGFLFFYLGILLVIGQGGLVRVLSNHLHSYLILGIGLFLVPLPLALFGFSPPRLWLSLLVLVPISLGSSLVLASLSGLASLTAPPSQQGYALGCFRSFGSLGRVLGPLTGALLYGMVGYRFTYVLLAMLLSGLFVYTLLNSSVFRTETHKNQ